MTRRRFDTAAFQRRREDLGLSLADLAEQAGISRSALNQLAAGRRHAPQPRTYRALIHALDLRPGDLLMDESEAA